MLVLALIDDVWTKAKSGLSYPSQNNILFFRSPNASQLTPISAHSLV